MSSDLQDPVVCPFCDSTETELIALFGMQMMTSQFYCRQCHSIFEAVKRSDILSSRNVPEDDE